MFTNANRTLAHGYMIACDGVQMIVGGMIPEGESLLIHDLSIMVQEFECASLLVAAGESRVFSF